MAKHLAQGREFPIFFYGQHYGFSLVEAAAAGALGFLIVGTSALSLNCRCSGSGRWESCSCSWLSRRLSGARRSFWITTVLLLNPAWAVWSMKARGGYITSFTATAALLWLLVEDGARLAVVRWLVASVLTFIIYLAQPLWLPGVLPIVVVALVSRRPAGVGHELSVRHGGGHVPCQDGGRPPARQFRPDRVAANVAQQIYVHLTGGVLPGVSARTAGSRHTRPGARLVRHPSSRGVDAGLSASHETVLPVVARAVRVRVFDTWR